MANIAFLSNEWLNLTRPYLPGAENPMVVIELVKAARRFLTDVHLLYAEFGPLDVVGDPPTFTVAPTVPAGTEMVDAKDITWDGTGLLPATEDWLRRRNAAWATEVAEKPTHWLMAGEDAVRLWPGVNVDALAVLSGRAYLRPTLDATEIDERIYKRYGEAVAAACIASMCAMKGKPWTDMTQVQDYSVRYNRQMGEARIFVMRSGTQAQLNARIEVPA